MLGFDWKHFLSAFGGALLGFLAQYFKNNGF